MDQYESVVNTNDSDSLYQNSFKYKWVWEVRKASMHNFCLIAYVTAIKQKLCTAASSDPISHSYLIHFWHKLSESFVITTLLYRSHTNVLCTSPIHIKAPLHPTASPTTWACYPRSFLSWQGTCICTSSHNATTTSLRQFPHRNSWGVSR